MQYIIPDVPSEVSLWLILTSHLTNQTTILLQLKTQIQRETLLAKEAKYEHGLKKGDFDYDDLVGSMRDNNNAARSDRTPGKQVVLINIVPA